MTCFRSTSKKNEPGVYGHNTHIYRDLGAFYKPRPGRGLGHRVIESMLEIDSVSALDPVSPSIFQQDWILTLLSLLRLQGPG